VAKPPAKEERGMSQIIAIYKHPAAMEPMLPAESGTLAEKAAELLRCSARLSGKLHPITLTSVVELVRVMNSYYSNRIEGHATHPLDIERALRKDYSADPAKRALQLESAAHVTVQRELERQLDTGSVEICEETFLKTVHRQFYQNMPPEFQVVETKHGGTDKVIPGEFRTGQVEVNRHIAPDWQALPAFIRRFSEAYRIDRLDPLTRIIAIACSHHRLAWIHPYLDGNGRVIRLFSDAFFRVARVEGYGLWTISRGLARRREEYMQYLADADSPRRNDLDGRGSLSEAALRRFCDFFLDCALDQVSFMSELFNFDAIQQRIEKFAEIWIARTKFPNTLRHLLSTVFLKGEVTRGDAAFLLRLPDRTARRKLGELMNAGILESSGPALPVRLRFSTTTTAFYLPHLYPENVEAQTTMTLM
jgi:Fic family protein